MRIGVAVGVLLALGTPLAVFGQDTPPLQRPLDALSYTLDGSLRLSIFGAQHDLERARSVLNGLALSPATFVAAEASIRFDLRLPDQARAFVELANRPYLDGLTLPLGDGGPGVITRQLFVEIESGDLTFRAGAFDYAWKSRPHDDPFFLDLGGSESFFSPRAIAERDLVQPAALLVKWKAHDFVETEFLAATIVEGGATQADESLVAVFANFPASEKTAFFVGYAVSAGPGSGPLVKTLALGGDGYFGLAREFELFGDLCLQSGGGHERAAQAGVRWVGGPTSVEAAVAFRSGAFRSYENQNRFLIVDSAQFGLDWDTNLLTARANVAHRWESGLTAKLDVGWFRVPESPVGVTAISLGARALGIETDAALSFRFSRVVTLTLRAAALTGADALEQALADARTLTAFLGEVQIRW